ncbi:hypothetical protein KSP24_02920 [Paenibacillus sp. AK121]|uniref:hypothetical protein n=1 Tax=Paenibacillus sp. AK121 TaxID=2849670 RepID=UPI001C221574|nr:hypothetical protein [Paenibacillus sp. AK121]MBU9705877.1 hypothetical protein [Paenibacillus sp. AK121]
MNYGRRISNGVMYVGVVFSVLLGGLVALALIFGEDSDWWMRIFFALLAIWAFVAGFVDGGVDEKSTNGGIFRAKRQEKEEARRRLKARADERNIRDLVVLSTLLSGMRAYGGPRPEMISRAETIVMQEEISRRLRRVAPKECSDILTDIIREKSAEVLRIGEDDAA